MPKLKRYQALRDELISYIKDNNLKSNDKLPTVREIISKMGYSYATVNRTLIEMTNEGLIRKVHGSGLFVNDMMPQLKTTNLQVAMIVPNNYQSFRIFLGMIVGAKSIFNKEGVNLSVYQTEMSHEKEIAVINELIDQHVNGMIIFLEDHYIESSGYDHIVKLKQQNIPFVLVDRYIPQLNTNFVVINNEVGVFKACAYLKYNRDCQKIIFIRATDIESCVSSSVEKLTGYRNAIHLLFNDASEEIITVDKFIAEIEKIGALNCPVGVLFNHDELIMEALKKILDSSKHLPDNIHIFGYANSLDKTLYPTVEQFNDKVGEKAAEILLDQIKNNKKEVVQIRIEPKLIIPSANGSFHIES